MTSKAGDDDQAHEEHRADAAHPRSPPPASAGGPSIAGRGEAECSPPPAQVVGSQCPDAIEKLELLDDTVFEAIAGRPGALDQLRRLWPTVLAEVGPALVEESREQYLRHALSVWRQCVEGDQIRNPAVALATLEVICLLFAPGTQ